MCPEQTFIPVLPTAGIRSQAAVPEVAASAGDSADGPHKRLRRGAQRESRAKARPWRVRSCLRASGPSPA